MPLIIDSYATTAGSIVDTRRLATAIKEVIITEDLDNHPESRLNVQSYGDYHPLFITGTYPGEAKIPPFAHPISILNIRGKNFICADLRLFLKKEVFPEFQKRISNRVDFEYAVSRTVLNLFWAGGRSTEFTSGFRFSGKVFSEWVCQILNSGLGLEVQELMPVQVTAMAYYYSLCQNNIIETWEDRNRIKDWITDQTQLSPLTVSQTIDKLKPMAGFDHFIENLKLVVDNIRIQKLDVGIFMSLIRSSWYGLNAAQVLGACIEHPPTWTAIVYHTLATKSYQRCVIGQVALKAGKRGEADAFMRHYSEMFSSSLRLENRHGDTTIDVSDVINHDAGDTRDYDIAEMVMHAESRMPILN